MDAKNDASHEQIYLSYDTVKFRLSSKLFLAKLTKVVFLAAEKSMSKRKFIIVNGSAVLLDHIIA